MQAFVASLRAVNVGGTGELAMADVRAICERQGYETVRTYIARGNVVFRSDHTGAAIKAELQKSLAEHSGGDLGVIERSGAEMAGVLIANPFASAAPNRTVAILLNAPPTEGWEAAIAGNKTSSLLSARAKSLSTTAMAWRTGP